MIALDMPMPEGCEDCPLNEDFCCCRGITCESGIDAAFDLDFDFETRPGWCPLKEVSPCVGSNTVNSAMDL